MKRFPYIIIVIVIFSIAASSIKAEEQQVKSIMGNDSFLLSDFDLETAKKKALEGDAESAYRIHLHYKLGKFDTVSSFGWLQIAANHNHASAQYSLGYIYMKVSRAASLKTHALRDFGLKKPKRTDIKEQQVR